MLPTSIEVESALKTAHDIERLAVLQQLDLLDSATEESFDRLTRMASKITNSPVSLVTLVDANRQFFKSQVGLPEPYATLRETPLTHSFCKHVVAENIPLIVEDARLHPVLKDNLAVPDLNVIGYLGMPLTTSEGVGLGSFCIIDDEPRAWTDREIKIMRDLAELVMTEIELRAQVRARKTAEKTLQKNVDSLEKIVAARTQALKEANDQLQVVDRLKSKFIDDISHELRTPVTNINLYLNLLGSGKPDSRPKYEKILNRQSKRLTMLLEGILEFSDLQKRLETAEFAPVNLNLMIAEIVNSFKLKANEKEIDLSFVGRDNLPEVWGDAVQVGQIATAILKNAVAYTPAGSIQITTGFEPQTNCVFLSVQDSGIGLDEEEQTHCFERFYRGKRVASLNQVSGTGLGLTLVRDIVALHKGRVEIHSGVNQGATFVVYLPAAV